MREIRFEDLPNDASGLLRRMASELVCPICLSYYDEPMLTPCLHTYCKACILRSLETLARCPLCKHGLTKRQLNPMPSVAEVVTNFQELQTAYEEMTGQAISQEPIHSSQWQLQPDTHLTQKYPYPTKDDHNDYTTYSNDNEFNAIPTATAFQNRDADRSSITANQFEEILDEPSQMNDTNIPIGGFSMEDTDATQISVHPVASHSVASSPELTNRIHHNSLPPSQTVGGADRPTFYTSQFSDLSLDADTEPSPNFWKSAIGRRPTLNSKCYVVLATHLPPSFTQTELNSIVGALNGRVIDEFSQEVTHIVTTTDQKNLARRTLKYLQGIVCGIWIVDKAWLEKCKLAGRFVTEDDDEVDGDEASDRSLIPRIARQAKAANVMNCPVYPFLHLFGHYLMTSYI
ncbi:hypothetical protein BC943DRAFT_35029 [Umbelopsis sp. AD052]|nr:hypothetical protein BC943DRAFT_35029 [Umbelopsis sp. AD052]